ncbi:S8 family serine peptidase [Streptomyces sp. NBC_00347]|uniref:S8 family peptidase n=1 Tax=Streptomyces sp. NBC_00347 TaxID=2975721 RepID=UPI00225AB9FB|nr:S8 family serine peptidase [Streptomyces sp. NBC_00347]MCX5129299.1 S8 family serine peptidase [Streptomyces sp. NBC_00347]
MRTPRIRRTGAAVSAAVAAIALAAGLTTPAAAAPMTGRSDVKAGQQPAAGTEFTQLTLITGDQVTVDPEGRPVGFAPAKGREKIPVSVRRDKAGSSLVPLDARHLIESGRLDPRLFDLNELSRPEYVKARGNQLKLIVRYDGAAPAAKSALRSAGGLRVDRTYGLLDAEAVTATPASAAALWDGLTGRQGGAARLAAPSGIASVWLDGIRAAGLDKSTRQIGADKAWAAGYDGTGVKIAILDTGIDTGHPDLAGRVVAAADFSESGSTADRYGHGTHVASIAAGTGAASGGKYKGVAPGAKLLNGKVLGDEGYGSDSGILAGIEWAVAQGAQVINLSLGGPDAPEIDPVEAAVNQLSADKGVLFAVAAGNDGKSGPGTIDSPGSADAALTVGAVDKADVLADFSGIGPRAGDGAVKPDVTAPGVDITAAAAVGSAIERKVGQNPAGYLSLSGTSMAAPHAAGAAALLKQQHPTWTGAQLKGILAGSTKPGPYNAFQQGTGLISVEQALGQSLVAEPLALAFADQEWPHEDDAPVTRKVTYRNLGTAPVTLNLSVTTTGPDGKPAPAGFLSFARPHVTVPAGGIASVDLTLNTRLGGSVNGRYTAHAVATAAGQSVRTAIVADREVETYALTIRHIGRDGKRPAGYFSNLQGVSGLATGKTFYNHEGSDSQTLRVPKGSYMLDSHLWADPENSGEGLDWISQPRLDVTGPTTVTVDARTTKPVDITVPSDTPVDGFITPSYELRVGGVGYTFGWWLSSGIPLRTRGQGPGPVAGSSLTQRWDKHAVSETEEYHATLGGPVRTPATGYIRHLKSSDLATVNVDHGSSASGKEGVVRAVGRLPGNSGPSSMWQPRPLPNTVTLHLSSVDGVKWALSASQFGRDENGYQLAETSYAVERAYPGGRTHRERFNTAAAGPRVDTAAGLGLYRKGDRMWGTLPLLADGAGHDGTGFHATGRTVLYRNGVVVGNQAAELRDAKPFDVASGEASYKLVASSTQDETVSRTSSKVTATWWFRSGTTATGAPSQLPVSVVRFAPPVRLDGTVNPGYPLRVPVTVQGPAAGKGLKSLTVSVSYDDGYTWQTLPVLDGAVTTQTPPQGGHASLRGTVVDTAGNKSEVTVLRAYLTD